MTVSAPPATRPAESGGIEEPPPRPDPDPDRDPDPVDVDSDPSGKQVSRSLPINALWSREWKPLLWIVGTFVVLYWLPSGNLRFDGAVTEALALTKWYAREHVLLCLVPAFYIAGAIGVFLDEQAVLRYLGPGAPKAVAYGVASVSGAILAVCSCTVLPLFAGIYMTGAGLGPAAAFLYAGPAVNVLAIALTATVLGLGLGAARALGAVLFSVVIGITMHRLFRRDEEARSKAFTDLGPSGHRARTLTQHLIYFGLMIGILVVANWGRPPTSEGIWPSVYASRWVITAALAAGLGITLVAWFGLSWVRLLAAAVPTAAAALLFPANPTVPFVVGTVALSAVVSTAGGELEEWFTASWGFAKQILPLLLIGILFAGLLLGRPGEEGLIPSQWIADAVGGNSMAANAIASVAGAFMYFATLTEVPILQGLLGNGMGEGPALSLLLAGPAVSLPSILVIRSVIGTRKTAAFIALVMVTATVSGLVYGTLIS